MKDLRDYTLGIQIFRDQKNRQLAFFQVSYIDKILSRYAMQDSKKGMLSFVYGVHLSKK